MSYVHQTMEAGACITEKCRTGPGLEPRVFRYTYECSTS